MPATDGSGGLLQKVNRDTMAFATKLNYTVDSKGQEHMIMKRRKTDSGNTSLPGVLKVLRNVKTGGLDVFPYEHKDDRENVLQVVYDHGPVDVKYELFSDLKKAVDKNWAATPRTYYSVSDPLKEKIDAILENDKLEKVKRMKSSE